MSSAGGCEHVTVAAAAADERGMPCLAWLGTLTWVISTKVAACSPVVPFPFLMQGWPWTKPHSSTQSGGMVLWYTANRTTCNPWIMSYIPHPLPAAAPPTAAMLHSHSLHRLFSLVTVLFTSALYMLKSEHRLPGNATGNHYYSLNVIRFDAISWEWATNVISWTTQRNTLAYRS